MNNFLNKAAEDARRLKKEEAERRAKERKREAIEAIVEIQGKLYERAAAYMNLMLLGGYAGAFTIWSNTANNLSERANIAVGLSLGISISTYIFFEVYKMIVTSFRFIRMRKLVNSDLPPEDFLKRTLALYKREVKPDPAFIPVWMGAVFVALTGAVAAFILLFYNYLSILVGFSRWPS
ncbi:hypothetical protein ABLE93_04855 [Xanthobacter sp. KR7-65]|uniref:hypothetical protein n=1 Tax=Xanthobacter sp. KR7-65 TaxID=3156612 RepID=UPI0032B5634B